MNNLVQKLIDRGILNEKKQKEIEYDIKKTGKSPEEIIIEKGIIPEDVMFRAKSEILKIPLKKVSPEDIPLETLELIPEEPTANYKMIPLARKGNIMEIGMVYPENIPAQDALRFLSRQGKFKYEVFLITLEDFNKLLKQHKNLKSEANKVLTELEKTKKGITERPKEKVGTIETISEEAPIIKMVFAILRHALEASASDVHIEPGRDKLKIRFRVDGVLYPTLFLPLSVYPSITARIKILANLKIDENRIPQDGRFSTKIDDKDLDFRVATYPTLNGEKVAIRILDPTEGLKSYDALGLRGKNLEKIKEAIKKPYGMILATGPTGSGKTTTLYALMRLLNNESVNIVTIEDPIEYSIAGVNQSQINPEIGYTFAQGLRQILRQDPNIIMVGEVRDEETANLVTHAALTGHVVLSTLHTNSAVGVIPRLIDMGVRSFLIPYTLRAAISQRLVRMLCPYCKKEVVPSDKIKEYILSRIKTMPPAVKKEVKIGETIYIFQPKGCEKCNFKGYTGRIGLFEVLPMSDELSELILKSPTEGAILKLAQKQGMLTMEQEGIFKILAGETTFEEVARVTEEK
ncbi:GspE/PulE family protein [Patescibacteria group bacterium]|nr:GspE/PulE family protein [Patescibacteria group bacterium]